MDGDQLRGRLRANRVRFPAADSDYRAARQRCAESCAKYNSQAEFCSPEARARLWQAIVAPQDKESSPDLIHSANASQRIEIQPTDHKDDGTTESGLHTTEEEVSCEMGPSPAEPARPHSLQTSQASRRSPIDPTSPVARPAVTPPPSPLPGYKEIHPNGTIAHKRGDADPVDDYAITTDTPPPSRKSSLLTLKRPEPTPASQHEHDPAITNPFIVDAPYVKPPCYIDYGSNLHIGAGTFINRNFMVIDSPVCQIRIGERCLFGPNVILAAVEHPLDAEERISPIGAPSYASSIEVGDECWIAAGVKILCGVKIGSGCVIGAGSVVTKDVPDGCIAYGNPARVARVCSPKFFATGQRPIARENTFDSSIASPEEVNGKTFAQRSSAGSTCAGCCTSRSARRAIQGSIMQHGKDILILLFGIASLVQWFKGV